MSENTSATAVDDPREKKYLKWYNKVGYGWGTWAATSSTPSSRSS